MNFFINELLQNTKFKQLVEQIEDNTSPMLAISGLVDVEKIHTILAIKKQTNKPICLVTYNEIQAKKLCQDIQSFGEKAWYFPKREIAAYDYIAQSKDLPYERISVLNQMVLAKKEKRQIIVVTTIEAIMQNMINKEELYQDMVDFEVGKPYSLEKLKTTLLKLGYDRVELVENKGQYSIRGGILDVGLSEKIGVRIEFWGDEVDSIRYFKLSSQRSTDMLRNITIFPAHELLVNDLQEVLARIEEAYPEEKEDIELIKEGDYTSKVDKYFNQFYTKQSNFLDYISQDYLLFLDENSKIKQRQENIILDNNNLIDSLIEKERFVPEAIQNMSNFEYNMQGKQIIYLEQNDIIKNMPKFYFDTREINFHGIELDMLLSDLEIYKKESKKVVLLSGNEINSKKVCEFLKENEINYRYVPKINENLSHKEQNQEKQEEQIEDIKLNKSEILVTTGGLSSGFENGDLGLVVISMDTSFEVQPKRRKLNNTFKQAEKIVFADLKPGDFVVHQTHGIGQFVGVNTITADGVTKDYIKIEYRNDDMLYVPTSNLDTVRKYIGGGEASPKLNKLGGKEWSATTSKVKKHLEEIAKDLVELYAKRQKVKGFAFSPDTPWQKQFEDSFPYSETDDQLRCIEEVKKDMERDTPMDRLLCRRCWIWKNRSGNSCCF